jgi:toxin-antitoxin system PIN domain toxin
MVLVDANVLIYAVDRDAPHHASARRWLENALSGVETVGMPWIVLLAFLRLVTREAVLRRPLPVEGALAYIDEWLEQPPVRVLEPTTSHWAVLRALLRNLGAAGNLTSDAHLAALAIEHGAAVCSADRDLLRFPGIELVGPWVE